MRQWWIYRAAGIGLLALIIAIIILSYIMGLSHGY